MCACGRPTERISVTVKPTTGGQFAVTAASDDSVDYLKLLVSQKLKVPKERICLLYRNRWVLNAEWNEGGKFGRLNLRPVCV